MFQDNFLLHFLFNVLRLLFVLFGSMFQEFSSLSPTKNSLHFCSPFSLLLLYIHMPTTLHVISSQMRSNQKQCHLPSSLQSYNDTNITPTLSYHLILTCMSRLWLRKGACFFIQWRQFTVLMLKSDIMDFMKVVIHFESLGV